MAYGQLVMSRLFQPGTLMLILGAVCVYSSTLISGKFFPESEKANILIKLAGCAVALLGTMLIFS